MIRTCCEVPSPGDFSCSVILRCDFNLNLIRPTIYVRISKTVRIKPTLLIYLEYTLLSTSNRSNDAFRPGFLDSSSENESLMRRARCDILLHCCTDSVIPSPSLAATSRSLQQFLDINIRAEFSILLRLSAHPTESRNLRLYETSRSLLQKTRNSSSSRIYNLKTTKGRITSTSRAVEISGRPLSRT